MMVALDGTVVSVANPTIGADLGASLAGLQWVTNGYLLALAVLLVAGGKLGDRFGRKLVLCVGVSGFALASLGCALSSSIGPLIACRVAQGLAGALLMPNTLAIIRATFAPGQLNRAVGIWGGSSSLATASGPIVGGMLAQHVSWQSIFLLNVPLGALAAAVTWAAVEESRDERSGRGLDPPGVALLLGSLFALVWGIMKTQTHGWGAGYTLGFLGAGAALLAAFAWREATARQPLIPLDLFRSRSFSAGVALVAIGLFALFGVLFFITLYLQRVHGYSPVETGVRMLPLTGVIAFTAPIGGVLTERFGPRLPLAAGMLILGAAMLGLRPLAPHSGYGAIWPWFLAMGVALGLVIVSATQAIVGDAPVERGGIAGGLQATANQLGGVLGTAVLGSVLAGRAGAALGARLEEAGVSGALAGTVLEWKGAVAQGLAPPLPRAAGAELAGRVGEACHLAFLDGLHAVILVGALVAFAGAGVALLVRRGRPSGGAPAFG